MILAYKSCFDILENNVFITNEICNFVQEAVIKDIAQKKICKKKKEVKWFSEEALQIAEKRREMRK